MRKLQFISIQLGFAAFAGMLPGCGNSDSPQPPSSSQPRFVRQVDWVGKGTWLKADTHMHTKFSDGEHTVADVVSKAKEFGCNVVAITDHGDRWLKAATREYLEAINAERRKHPDLILFAGLEWNWPPHGGSDHAVVLIPPEVDEWSVLSRFKEQFDDLGREPHRAELADEALRWLEQHAVHGNDRPVIIFEHPSRKRAPSKDIAPEVAHWRSVNDLLIGFSGAPGHQRYKPTGGYSGEEKTIDRWDPVAAREGDAWDTLLAQGLDVWAAHAPSDFHNNNKNSLNDCWPGEFSETWLYVPEKTASGVLRAFRAGTFFGAHGHIVRQAELTLEAVGLPRPATVGEVVQLPQGSHFTVKFRCVVPPKDWEGKPNRLDLIELIGITPTATRIHASLPLDKEGVAQFDAIAVPPGGIVVRARGKRIMGGAANLCVYTNPIRVQSSP
jgi:PHP domain